MHYYWGQTDAKKGIWPLWTMHFKQIWQWLVEARTAVYIPSKSSEPKICSEFGQSLKKGYSRTVTKLIPLLQPEHGFLWQNEPERCVKYRIIRLKNWWWSPFAWIVDVALQNTWVLYHINKDKGDESLPLLACNFLKYSMEGRSSLSHVKIQNVPSDARY